MKRRHAMPFGAQLRDDGSVRFRMWAPSVERLELCLDVDGRETVLPMTHCAGGWYETVTDRAGAGSRYCYRVNQSLKVPDPASRYNPKDVHGPSQVIDPRSFNWQDESWAGRSWEDAVLYELHVGTFTPGGTFLAAAERIDYLARLGVTAVELMPVADFPGARNWGYDGVLPFAPDSRYGQPDHLKYLVQVAHRKGLMVFLDVVYNHFGPEGNYLHAYAPQFFTEGHRTPWGSAINFDGAESRAVRDFFIHNALYWLEEYHFDGLRLDAVHAIFDDSDPEILTELAAAIRRGPGSARQIHLVLENYDNAARYLERDAAGLPLAYTAQWNDDVHHGFHVLVTGESDGYYADYAGHPLAHLGRCLAEGFAYQGEPSRFRGGRRRGESSAHLPPTAFVAFLQNHDQVGNRALGERLTLLTEPGRLRAVTAILLLAPNPPLLFMGEEFAAATPFPFFCDFEPRLAQAVAQGRRKEFARFDRFRDPAAQTAIPDPGDPATFERAKLVWESLDSPDHDTWLKFYQELLALRHREIIPRLRGVRGGSARFEVLRDQLLLVRWRLGDGTGLALLANLASAPFTGFKLPDGDLLYASDAAVHASLGAGSVPAWSVAWFLDQKAVRP